MSPIRIQLPAGIIKELESELQGTRPQEAGGFIWYSRESGEAVYFMTEIKLDERDQRSESRDTGDEYLGASNWWGVTKSQPW